MTHTKRRSFLKLIAASGVVSSAGFSAARGAAQAHVVIIGAGTGGATAAKYLKLGAPDLRVTVIEANRIYQRCYGSSEVLTGEATMEDITISRDALRDKYGVEFIFDTVMGVDPDSRAISLKSGETVSYDRLIVSPGIDFFGMALRAIVKRWPKARFRMPGRLAHKPPC